MAMISHQDIWPTTAGLAGLTPPPHGAWKDENGVPIYFDGINQSAYSDAQDRQISRVRSSLTSLSTKLGAIRVNDWKFHYGRVQDAWLGPAIPLTRHGSGVQLEDGPRRRLRPVHGWRSRQPPRMAHCRHRLVVGWEATTAWTVALQGVASNSTERYIRKIPEHPDHIPGGVDLSAQTFLPFCPDHKSVRRKIAPSPIRLRKRYQRTSSDTNEMREETKTSRSIYDS